ncbi:hypothetical protein G8O24_43465, partial [Bradyrhizobium sp. INPA01-394B]|nr:hypothetical protein [Bradyrhizobium campsiandrae]
QFVALNMCRERAKEFRFIESEISESIRREPDGDGFLDPKQAALAAKALRPGGDLPAQPFARVQASQELLTLPVAPGRIDEATA